MGDDEKFFQKTALLQAHPVLRQTMGCNARRIALERYGRNQSADRVRTISEEMVQCCG